MNLEPIFGNAWMFGDNIDTDCIYSSQHLHILNSDQMASFAFENIKPEFAKKVQHSDIIITGRNFGCGSSREHAILCLKANGIGAIVALSFARIFYRNAINCALPVLTLDIDEKQIVDIYSSIFDGDEVELNFEENSLEAVSSGKKYNLNPIPEHLQEIINDGGLIKHLKKNLD
jgi:3-isopropylmalate/(R)-2-methylmalate dehydratase small subunit